MAITVNVNGLSLAHKGSNGIVTATLPDVCKTPSPGGPVPIPYPNIAFSKDLAKGSKKVKADGGNSCAIKGSEFSMSVGDEPGTVGGIKSGVNKGKATWLSYSFDVKIEGKNACRLTDKMLMNKGNTVSMGGEIQAPISPDDIIYKLCEIACECKAAVRMQQCVADKIKEQSYDGDYPKSDSEVWQEVSMRNGSNGWEVIQNRAGTGPTSNPFTPRGGIRPDIVLTDGAGNPTRMIEMKFPGDTLNANQQVGGAYDQAAEELGIDYDSMDVEDACDFCWGSGPPGSPVPVTAPQTSSETQSDDGWSASDVAIAAGATVAVVAVGALVVASAPVSGTIAAIAGLFGLTAAAA